MNSKYNVHLVIVCLLSFGLANFVWISAAIAGEFTDEFDSKQLNEDFWEMKPEGKASYEIAGGKLTMTSPGVNDGILMYWKKPIGDEDFSVEIKAEINPSTEGAAVINFIKEMLPPMLNTTINPKWLSVLWCGTAVGNAWVINDDNWKRTAVKGPEFEGIWKAEIKGGKIHWYFDGKEVIVVDKVAKERYACFGPDTYTSHYSGEMTIDWIKLSGPTVPSAAVEFAGKLSVLWGELKSKP